MHVQGNQTKLSVERNASSVDVRYKMVTNCPAFSNTEAGRERCPQNSKDTGYLYTYGEKCYQFILVEKTWNEAKAYCYAKGAALMNLENSRFDNHQSFYVQDYYKRGKIQTLSGLFQ